MPASNWRPQRDRVVSARPPTEGRKGSRYSNILLAKLWGNEPYSFAAVRYVVADVDAYLPDFLAWVTSRRVTTRTEVVRKLAEQLHQVSGHKRQAFFRKWKQATGTDDLPGFTAGLNARDRRALFSAVAARLQM